MNLVDKIKQLRDTIEGVMLDEFYNDKYQSHFLKGEIGILHSAARELADSTDNILKLVDAAVGQIRVLDETEVTYDLREALKPFLKAGR